MFFATACRLLAGLALFVAAVRIIRSGLEDVAEAGLRSALRFMAGTPARGMLVGVVVTAAVQSSSATTMLVVAFADARVITLRDAVALILGSNVGSTATIQMLTLNVHEHGPLIMGAGLAAIVLSAVRPGRERGRSLPHLGRIVLGIGLLFHGLWIVTTATAPLTESKRFADVAILLGRNPVAGLLGGLLISAVLQSSSVTIAMTITACAAGRLGLAGAVPVILGANVGTCATAIIAAAWSTIHAKRAAAAHLFFNAASAGLFMAFLHPFVAFASRTGGRRPVSTGGLPAGKGHAPTCRPPRSAAWSPRPRWCS